VFYTFKLIQICLYIFIISFINLHLDICKFIQTEKERETLLEDIKALEEAARAKIPSAKLTQTRLENRLERPRMEQCRDAAQEGLVDEVGQLSDSKDTLEERLANARLHIFRETIYKL